MASTTSLLNRALIRVGAKRITSLEGTGDTEQLIRDTYDDIRQSLLRSHPWNFATFRSRLARDVATSAIGFLYAFRKPGAESSRGEWLRTVGVFSDDAMTCPARYRDQGGLILSDALALTMLSIHDVTDPDAMDPLFREALGLKLAAEYAIVLSNSKSMHDTYAQLHEAALARARGIGAMDNPPEPLPVSSWESERFGGAGGIASIYEMP